MPKRSRHTRRAHRRKRQTRKRGGEWTPEQRNAALVNHHFAVKGANGYTRSLFNQFQGFSLNEEKAKKTFTSLYNRLRRDHERIVDELDTIIPSHPHNAALFTRPLLYELELLRAAASRNYDGMIHAIPFNKSSKYFTEMTENRRKLKALLDTINASLAKYASQFANLSMTRGDMGNNFMSGNLHLEGVSPASSNVPERVSSDINLRNNFMRGNIEI